MNGRARRFFTLQGGRRSGFILITALIIILLGGALSVGIFALANSMYATNLLNRRGYESQIDVNSYIEQAKGFIVAKNMELGASNQPVLHGKGGVSDDYFPVNSLSDLQVCTPDAIGNILSRDIPLSADRGVGRRLTLQVYDANYRIEDVKFVPTADLPPSLYPSHLSVSTPWGPTGGGAANHYKTYGAYLIRVELFRDGVKGPLRRTEEAFFQVAK